MIVFSCFLFINGCSVDSEITNNEWFDPEEYYAGGNTTLFEATSGAFSTPSPNLSLPNLEKHLEGDLTFEATFVTAPATNNAGLGPIYNNVSCVSCHILDGRGDKPTVFRISIPGADIYNGPNRVPGMGTQLQDKAVVGEIAEGLVDIFYTEDSFQLPDGTTYSLRKPNYTITNSYIPLPAGTMLSVRAAPPVFGLGLLESIPENDIINYSDEFDNDGDGISGKVNYVYDFESGITTIGRFGWKANQPHLNQQTSGAFNGDMGITSPMFQSESCEGQIQHDGLPDDPEIDLHFIEVTSFYTKTLAVPAPRNLEDENVMLGKQLFFEIGCESCHKQKWQTSILAEVPELANQTIYPYSDMLLHDMGEGLADNRPDFLASGSEWKTRPLWGIGLTQVANGHTNFLHDARARNLFEAIMWHGGEAESSKLQFSSLSSTERNALISFLEAL